MKKCFFLDEIVFPSWLTKESLVPVLSYTVFLVAKGQLLRCHDKQKQFSTTIVCKSKKRLVVDSSPFYRIYIVCSAPSRPDKKVHIDSICVSNNSFHTQYNVYRRCAVFNDRVYYSYRLDMKYYIGSILKSQSCLSLTDLSFDRNRFSLLRHRDISFYDSVERKFIRTLLS